MQVHHIGGMRRVGLRAELLDRFKLNTSMVRLSSGTTVHALSSEAAIHQAY